MDQIRNEALKEKYNYLIGKCFKRSNKTYEKILNIVLVDKTNKGDIIYFKCIRMHIEDADSFYYSSIYRNIVGNICEMMIEYSIIDNECFDKILDDNVKRFGIPRKSIYENF